MPSLPPATIWQVPCPLSADGLRTHIHAAAAAAFCGRGPVEVFFRADDIAVPGRRLRGMLDLFTRHRVPLGLALVPAWLTAPRWRTLQRLGAAGGGLWCWHQHGWRHANHEPAGKKQEFGPARAAAALQQDVLSGRRRLEALVGDAFSPVFTPPWNRCDVRTLDILARADFRAVSRSRGSRPSPPAGLAALDVDVDLHTRREADELRGWAALLDELSVALGTGRCGLMLHHQRMNAAARTFLDMLLTALRACPRVRLSAMPELLDPPSSTPEP